MSRWVSPFITVLILLGAIAPACADTIVESFEGSFGPWSAEIANPPVAWRVTPSTEQVGEGAWSLLFQVDGTNDDGQVFMLREIQLPAGSSTINLKFQLYSFGAGQIGAWNAIGFIGPYVPKTETDFTQSPWGARIAAITEAGWNSFSIERTLTSELSTTVYVAFGIDVVFEVQRNYHLDHAVLTGVPLQCGNGACVFGENPCNCPADCGSAPGNEAACSDGVDDDCDLLIDCADPDCGGEASCAGVVCDGDLVCETGEESCICYIDCGAAPIRESVCDDGIDDDCDGLTDCDDGMDCAVAPPCIGPGPCDTDGVCETGEDCVNCPGDCPSGAGAACGNGACEIADGEDCLSCPDDCNGKQGGKPSSRYCCGDGDGSSPVGCEDPRCDSDGNSCTPDPVPPSCCGDGVCEGSEDGFSCAIDCGAPPSCGDGNCDAGEDSCSCPADCGASPPTETVCGDGVDDDCDGAVDCDDADCSADPLCASCLGLGESCSTDGDCCSDKCAGRVCR